MVRLREKISILMDKLDKKHSTSKKQINFKDINAI